MIILDTNIVSERSKINCDTSVLNWLDAQNLTDLYLCTPVVAELSYGAHKILARDSSSKYLDGLNQLLSVTFSGRILPFDVTAALLDGENKVYCQSMGRTINGMDSMIGAICMANQATLATRNIRDFSDIDIKLINPFEHQS